MALLPKLAQESCGCWWLSGRKDHCWAQRPPHPQTPGPHPLIPEWKGKDKRLSADELFTGGSGQQLLQATKQPDRTREVLAQRELTERGKGSWAWGLCRCLAESVVGLRGLAWLHPSGGGAGTELTGPLESPRCSSEPFVLGVPWFSYSWSEHLKSCNAKGNLTFASPKTNLKGKLFNIGNYSVSLHLSAYLTYFVKLLCSHRMYYCYSSVKVFRHTEGSLHLQHESREFHYIPVKGPIWHGHQYLSNFFFLQSQIQIPFRKLQRMLFLQLNSKLIKVMGISLIIRRLPEEN